MNVCVVGYGRTGAWHSEALRTTGATLHTLVGRRAEPARSFAERYGFRRWTTELDDALSDGEVGAVVLANPSELHADFARRALRAGRHVLVEIPLAMTLADAEELVALARRAGRVLAVCHPLRLRPELEALRSRGERIRHVGGRFFIHRLENRGADGSRRSWTDNLLWHHMAHVVDVGLWLLGEPVRGTHSFLPPVDDHTGTPMDACLLVETEDDRSLVCSGSYYGRERIFDVLVVSDRDSYRLDVFGGTFTTGSGTNGAEPEDVVVARLTRDFVAAAAEGREPIVPGAAVLPALAVLQAAQDGWDARHGARPIPGRPLA